MAFVRRFTSEPTPEVLREIEALNIVDLTPPAPLTGAGSGNVLVIGEFEDGPFAVDSPEDGGGVLEVYGATDFLQKFGGLGYEYNGVPGNNPCARRRLQELWNGNGFLKIYRMRASRLIIARVDSSVGSVSFDPLAVISGLAGPYQLTHGQTLTATTGTGSAASTAIAGQPVTIPGEGASFGTIASGDVVGIAVDGGPRVNVVFAATDVTAALVIARINAAMGFTCAVLNGAQVDLSGLRAGYRGSVRIYDDLTPGAAAKIGQVAGLWEDRPRIEGGATNLPGIAAADDITITINGGTPVLVTFAGAPADAAAAAAVINAALGGTYAYVKPNGRLRLYGGGLGTTGSLTTAVGSPDAMADLGFAATTDTGNNNVGDVNAVTADEVAAIINATTALAAVNVKANAGPGGQVRVYNQVAGGWVRVTTGALATALGLDPLDLQVEATGHGGGQILAGTRVRTAGGLEWVTMQTLEIPAGESGPYVAKVRPATDDGSAAGTTAGTVTVLVDQPVFATLSVANSAALGASKTEPQMDNAYLAALQVTLDEVQASRDANYCVCARRSDAIVRGGLSNANAATAAGLASRKFITGDPLGTSVNEILTNLAQYQSAGSDRLFYTGKGLKVRVAEIAALGTAGGLGFTADGVITVRPDGPLATVCAMLPPESNPGEPTQLLEDFFEVDAFGESLTIDAYKAFKRAGVAVPRRDRTTGMAFQSGITSSTDPARKTMARRRMADFIQDSATVLLAPYSKLLNKEARRDECRGVWEGFLAGLLSEQNPQSARIAGYSVDDSANAGNTPENLAAGLYYLETKVRTLSSMDAIVVRTTVGEGVVISTAAV